MQSTSDEVSKARSKLATCPSTDPSHWSNQKELMFTLWQSYEATGSISPLMESVHILELYYDHAGAVGLPIPERIFICNHLGVALHRVSRQTKSLESLKRSIEVTEESLDLQTLAHPDRDLTISKLAFMHVDFFDLGGEISHLMVAISLLEQRLSAGNSPHPARHEVCMNLATFYMKIKDPGVLITAMRYAREAFDLCDTTNIQRQMIYHRNLVKVVSSAQNFLSKDPGAISDLKVELSREILSIWPHDHPDRASMYEGLVNTLFLLYTQDGAIERLNEAAALCRKGLEEIEGCTIEQQGALCESLTIILGSHHEATKDLSSLEEMVDRGRVACILLGDSTSDSLFGLLVRSMVQLSMQIQDHTLTEEAAEICRAHIERCSSNPQRRNHAVDSLCSVLQSKYSYARELVALDELIELLREERALCPASDTIRQTHLCKTLIEALHQRWGHVPDPLIRDEIEEITREIMQRRTEDLDDDTYIDQLANILMLKAVDAADILVADEAISLFRRSMAKSRLGDSLGRQAECCCGLSAALLIQYQLTRNLTCLEEAHTVTLQVRNALYASEEHQSLLSFHYAMILSHLARTVFLLGLHRKDSNAPLEALKVSEEALHVTSNPWQRRNVFILMAIIYSIVPVEDISGTMTNVNNAAKALLGSFDATVGEYSFDMLSDVLGCITNIWDRQVLPEVFALLHPVYEEIHRLLPVLGQYSLNNHSRLQAFSEYRRLGSCAFTCAWAAGDIPKALEHLEHSQGLLWSQAIQSRYSLAHDEKLAPNLRSELKTLFGSAELSNANAVKPTLGSLSYAQSAWVANSDALRRDGSRIEQLLHDIRLIPGLENFLRGPDYESLRDAASDRHPLVILVEGKQHHFAVILRSKEREVDIMTFHLDTKATSGSGLFLNSSSVSRAGESSHEDLEEYRAMRSLARKDQGHSILKSLWRVIVKPVLDRLDIQKAIHGQSRPRVTWLIVDAFAFLPIHAAGIYSGPQSSQECCSDYVVSSYTPTISALRRAQRSPGSQTPLATESLKLLLVADAEGGRAHGLASIRGVEEEIGCINDIAASRTGNVVCYHTGAVDVEQVKRDISDSHILHLACHGIQDTSDPLQSGFYLDNQRLAISDLMDVDLKRSSLAFLSACETAQGDREQPHQAMHLASAMLFAGFHSVIATMWSISDADGPFVAKIFYETILAQTHLSADSIAFALDAAVVELRRNGVEPRRWAAFVHYGE